MTANTNENILSRSVEAPPVVAMPLGYSHLAQAPWDWDVRIILWMGIVHAGLQLAQAAIELLNIFEASNVSWLSNFWGWNAVIHALLRSILPSLVLIGLLGVRSVRQGSRRLSVLAAGALLAFAAVEAFVSVISMFIGYVRLSLIPGTLLSILQNMLHGYAILIILIVVLTGPQMRAALR